MTPEEFAKEQRDFLIRTDKQSAITLINEFDDLKREIFRYLVQNEKQIQSKDLSFTEKFLANLSKKVDNLSIRAAGVVTRAQRRAINFASDSLKKFLPEIKTSIFSPDKPAVAKLIGRTQDGSSLTKFFQRLKEPIAQKAKETLVEGFAAGESNQSIARRLKTVAEIGRWRAMQIARTETNEVYRAATRDFYQEAAIPKYIWMSVLDPRTCLICWHLHGRMFSSSKKVFSHPNCRCVLIPFTGQLIKTGAEIFAGLETGFQKQILGPSKFELYKQGFKLNDFVGSLETIEYGKKHFIKSLETISENKLFPMAVQESRRGTTFLTAREFATAKSYAIKLGMPEELIFKRENMNTSWGVMFGREMLNVGPDAMPSERRAGRTLPPNSYISMKGAIAHEVIGHREAYLAGKMQGRAILEEVQASLRAAILALDLTTSERRMLIRDARFRLKKYGIIYSEVKDSLWLETFQQ